MRSEGQKVKISARDLKQKACDTVTFLSNTDFGDLFLTRVNKAFSIKKCESHKPQQLILVTDLVFYP